MARRSGSKSGESAPHSASKEKKNTKKRPRGMFGKRFYKGYIHIATGTIAASKHEKLEDNIYVKNFHLNVEKMSNVNGM